MHDLEPVRLDLPRVEADRGAGGEQRRAGFQESPAADAQRGHVPGFGVSAGAGRIDMNCTFGGVVGASVIATRSRPRSQVIVQSPRSAFSTVSKPFAGTARADGRVQRLDLGAPSLLADRPGTDSPPRSDPRARRPTSITRRATVIPSRHQRRRRLRHPRHEGAGRDRARRAPVDRAAPARVGEIAERDDADAVVGQPAHLRAEARQAAAVRDDERERAGLRDAEAEAVAAAASSGARRSRLASTAAGRGRQTCCISRSDARRTGGRSSPSRGGHADRNAATYRLRSAHGRQHAAHRAERAVGELRLVLPPLVLPPIAVRQPIGGHARRLERRRRHAERTKDVRRRRSRV